MKHLILRTILVLITTAAVSLGQGTEFSYQGSLVDGTGPANGSYDFEFALFDSPAGGSQMGSTISKNNVAVASGVFSVLLDFGSQFPGAARFMEIRVRVAGQPGITVLAPRQQISSQPYSVKSLNAETAANATSAATAVNALQLGGIAANQYVLTGDARLSDARSPLPGSTSYIQNGTTQQSASDFNISGSGTANIFDAGTQFNIGGQRVFATPVSQNLNLFIGKNAGSSISAGNGNTFVGSGAGSTNSSGANNSYFGAGAGATNTTSNFNSFFGHFAGGSTTGGSNSFFGATTGGTNTSGASNSFFGSNSGSQNTTGFVNSFFGASAGASNVSGNGNTAIGSIADFGNSGLLSATAIGRRALVSCSNCMVLGSINGINGATADTNVGIGTTTPTERLHVVGNGLISGNLTVGGTLNAALPAGSFEYVQNQQAGPQLSTNFFISGNGTANGTIGAGVINALTQYELGAGRVLIARNESVSVGFRSGSVVNGTSNTFLGSLAGDTNQGSQNTFVGTRAGATNVSSGNNSFFGLAAGDGVFNSGATTLIGAFTRVSEGIGNSTAIGFRALVSQSNSLVLGSISGVNGASSDTKVGIGTTTPGHQLTIGTVGGNPPVTTNAKFAVFGNNNSYGIFRDITNGVETIVGADSTTTDGTVGSAVIGTTTFHGVLFKTAGVTRMTITPSGIVGISSLGTAGTTALCRNAQNRIGNCSSSARYKNNIHNFSLGMDLIRRLRPVTFNWNEGGMHDLGLVAEEVAEIEPLLTTINDNGRIEGVKYDRIGVVLVNAMKEQQMLIEKLEAKISSQKEKIEKQHTEIRLLKDLLCSMNNAAGSPVCRNEP